MFKKLSIVIFFAFLAAVAILGSGVSAVSSQDTLADFKGNNCVTCHAQLTTPVTVSNRYFQWHSSVHRDAGVSCEKCHGGNASTTDKAKAHTGIRPVSDPQSALHFRNIA